MTELEAKENGDFRLRYRKSHAICIGINCYQNPKERTLLNAVNDARAVSKILNGLGFQIFELFDHEATKDKIMTLVTDILPNLVNNNDSLIVFYAGHGVTKNNAGDGSVSGYFVPYDGYTDKTSSLIDFYEIVGRLTRSLTAKHILFLIDCCCSGLEQLLYLEDNR